MILLPSSRGLSRRPEGLGGEINWNDSRTRDLIALAYIVPGGAWDAVRGVFIPGGATSTYEPTPQGSGLNPGTGTTGFINIPLLQSFSTSDAVPMTLFSYGQCVASTLIKRLVTLAGAASTGWNLHYSSQEKAAASINGATADPSTTGTDILTNLYAHLSMSYADDGVQTYPDLYVNGVLDNMTQANSDTEIVAGITITRLTLGATLAGAEALGAPMTVGGAVRRVWDADEHRSIAIDGWWGLLKRPRRVFWIGGAGITNWSIAAQAGVNRQATETMKIGDGSLTARQLFVQAAIEVAKYGGADAVGWLFVVAQTAAQKIADGVVVTDLAGLQNIVSEVSVGKISHAEVDAYLTARGGLGIDKTTWHEIAAALSDIAVQCGAGKVMAFDAALLAGSLHGTSSASSVTLLSLSGEDIAAIAAASATEVWAHADAAVIRARLTEAWGRLGLDPDAPLLTGQTSITFGDIVMALSEATGQVTVTRQ